MSSVAPLWPHIPPDHLADRHFEWQRPFSRPWFPNNRCTHSSAHQPFIRSSTTFLSYLDTTTDLGLFISRLDVSSLHAQGMGEPLEPTIQSVLPIPRVCYAWIRPLPQWSYAFGDTALLDSSTCPSPLSLNLTNTHLHPTPPPGNSSPCKWCFKFHAQKL